MMTYIIDFVKRIIEKRNIGVFIYLILNTILVAFMFSAGFKESSGIFTGLMIYFISLTIALSPIGEWILRLQTGCKEITRKDYLSRLEPLFNEVYAEAKRTDPSLNDDIKLYMSNEPSANAFATGRKTICLTKGFLSFSDEEIKATLAHEFGHLSNKDTDFILLVTVGNLIVSLMFILYRVILYFIGIMVTFASEGIAALISTIFIDIILVALMWGWTKLGTLLVLHSSRQNEFAADKFAYDCGYGDSLVSVLDNITGSGEQGLWANLASTHPDSDERIGHLHNLGVDHTVAY